MWVKNRLHLTSINSISSRATDFSQKTRLIRQELVDFVQNKECLSLFWTEKTQKLLKVLKFQPES